NDEIRCSYYAVYFVVTIYRCYAKILVYKKEGLRKFFLIPLDFFLDKCYNNQVTCYTTIANAVVAERQTR
ncbi:MAG: hypothetical protein MJ050_01295, partial [Phascolarctobacterium sp.]|nr:hypothetical protein [Phascolarctobacterium sp.]